jgi:hypothetical protein
MKRKLAIALLILVSLFTAYDLRPLPARGQSSSFRLLSPTFVLVGESIYHLDAVNPPTGWRLMPYASFTLPPVPASSLISLFSDVAITDTGEGWYFSGTGASGWTSAGQVPGSVATLRTSWGTVKAKYR